MIKNKTTWMLIIILSSILCFGDTVDEQLKKSGYNALREVIEQDKAKSIRYKSIYPEGDLKEKKAPADEIYGDDYVIKDIKDAEEVFKDKVIKYYPGLMGNSISGLTGLVNTISARTLKKGEYLIGGKFDYRKIKKSGGNDLDIGDGEKASITSFYVNAAMGVSQNFEIGYTLPVHSFDIKDDVLYPYNDKESGVGDVALRGKFSFPFGNEKGSAALGFGIKLPSGNEEKMAPGGVTGESDFEIFGAVSSQFGLLNGHINLMYSFTGNGDSTTGTPFTFNDDKFTFNVGVDYSRNENITLMFEINGEDWGAYGDRADLIAGIRAKVGKKMRGMIAIPISITNEQYYGYDFKLMAGWSYRF